jgi:hypothetical protein
MNLMQWTLGFVVINILLLLYLGYSSLKNVRKYKSGFTIGLLAFIIVFLIQNLMAAYFYFTMMPLYVLGTEVPVFVTTFIETIAFLVYVWVIRY